MLERLRQKLRLMAIKKRISHGYYKCRLCNSDIYPTETYYKVSRWYKGRSIIKICYCSDCMHSKEDVLKEVDEDSLPYGIAWIDSYKNFKKKDYTRYNKRKNMAK